MYTHNSGRCSTVSNMCKSLQLQSCIYVGLSLQVKKCKLKLNCIAQQQDRPDLHAKELLSASQPYPTRVPGLGYDPAAMSETNTFDSTVYMQQHMNDEDALGNVEIVCLKKYL